MKNFLAFCVYSVSLLILSLIRPSTADNECELSVPENGYAMLDGGVMVTIEDIEYAPRYVDHSEYIKYVCYEGHTLDGEEKIRCLDGQLTAEVPKCMQNLCNDPPNIENAYYESRELNQKFVRKLFLHPKCSEGFRLKQGSAKKIMCVRRDTKLVWSRSPICEVNPNCGDPGIPENSTRIGDSFYAGDEVTFFCDDKFRMLGMDNIKCLEDGTWSSLTPICQEIPYCGDPGTPISGFRKGNSFFEGDTVSFRCGVEGDELIGNNKITCGSDGQWSSVRPRCKPPSACPDLPNQAHILYSSPGRTRDYYIPGDEVIVSCQTGYKVDGGYDRLHCTEKKDGPQETVLENEYVYYDYGNAEKEEPEINEPHWKEDFLTCKEIICPYPQIPKFGYIEELQNAETQVNQTFPYEFTLNYGCSKSGYQLTGAHFSSCLETGWTPSTSEVKCKKIKCPEVTTPDNGFYRYTTVSRRDIGDIVTFGCYSNFNLTGSQTRECLENGEWSGDLPVCVGDTYCPDPGTPIGGHKYGNDYSIGANVSFACSSGDTLVGSKSRRCLDNGTWSGTEALCKKYTDFDRPLEMQFRLLTHLDSTVLVTDSMTAEKSNPLPTDKRDLPPPKKAKAFGRSLDLSYTKGNLVLYFIFDSSSSVGQKNFNLSVDFVKALVKRVRVTADGVRVGGAAFSKSIHGDQGFLPNEYFTTGDVVEALERLKFNKFKGGGTNIHGALENFETAIYPTLVQKLEQHKTHIFLLTDGNYNTGGDPRNLVKKMKRRGVEFSCVGISGKKETDMKVINDIASKSTNVYVLKDNDHLKWIVDKVLTDKVDYSRCGLSVKEEVEVVKVNVHGRIFGGNITKTYWPWMAMLRGPSSKSPNIKGFCGGSLIDRKWVLTAAHCMYYDETDINTRRGDKDIQVRLGYTKGDNHDYTQTISSEKIFIHEKFSFLTYDSDVALIKLERPADYEKRVRPVCLSPSDNEIPEGSTLYTEKSAGWAIGYGTFKHGDVDDELVFRDLREVALDIGIKDNCTTVLKKKGSQVSYTKNMFCAGGKTGVDTCKGDSGGPFMKHQYHTDGDGYWTQTGIVSFSPEKNCGLKGVYGYYTKVSAIRQWIDKVMKTN